MTTTQYYHIQRLISKSLQKVLEKEEVDRSVNQGHPAGGAEMRYATLTPWEQDQAI